jgi:hypothetical protein
MPAESCANNVNSRKTSIHPNLEQNQAFLTTSHLQTMAAEGRVFVVKLPYSHMATLPQVRQRDMMDDTWSQCAGGS